jgi:hypothetical protein
MDITKQDQSVLDQLNLGNIPEEDKKAVLEMIDERLEKRFLANLLLSLPEDKQKELETRVEAMKDDDAEKIIETILELHPDAKGVLERSAKEIIEELKRDGRSSEDGRSSVVGGQSSGDGLSSVVGSRSSEDSQSATNDQPLTTNNQPPTTNNQPPASAPAPEYYQPSEDGRSSVVGSRSSEDSRSSVVGGQSSGDSLSSVVGSQSSEDSQSATNDQPLTTNDQQPTTSNQQLTTNNQPPTISDQSLTTSDQPSPPPIP